VESALRHLTAGHGPALVCRWFDLHLLDRTGFRPELGHCVECGRDPEELANAWIVDAGGLVCARCAPESTIGAQALSVRALKSLRFLLVSDFESASLLRVDEALAAELERHLRAFLQNILDREIHTSRLLDELARLRRPAAATA
jgi:DNA repair protein RecO (recombination protein O)